VFAEAQGQKEKKNMLEKRRSLWLLRQDRVWSPHDLSPPSVNLLCHSQATSLLLFFKFMYAGVPALKNL